MDQPVITWLVRNAFPTNIADFGLNATSNEIIIQSIDFAHEGVTMEYVS